ncbi:hypothetical protein DIPPA_33380 [Diplonema papillatum]|nr:hypothetical protein DIPPA_33380 [Diplonema papillatum]
MNKAAEKAKGPDNPLMSLVWVIARVAALFLLLFFVIGVVKGTFCSIEALELLIFPDLEYPQDPAAVFMACITR